MVTKRQRPRRSHVLGGCSTCRRRHVKCDQKRPVCRTCRALGVTCEGFSDQVLWMRTDSSEEAEGPRRGTRRHLYTGKLSDQGFSSDIKSCYRTIQAVYERCSRS
jgi:arginine metabolism regulation protein II